MSDKASARDLVALMLDCARDRDLDMIEVAFECGVAIASICNGVDLDTAREAVKSEMLGEALMRAPPAGQA